MWSIAAVQVVSGIFFIFTQFRNKTEIPIRYLLQSLYSCPVFALQIDEEIKTENLNCFRMPIANGTIMIYFQFWFPNYYYYYYY